MESKKEQLQQELTMLNRLRENVKKELKNLDRFVGKWWTHESGDIVFVTHEDYLGSLYGYGINCCGNWFDYTYTTYGLCALNSASKKYTRESIKVEVEQALIGESNKRYKVGDVVKCLDGVELEVTGTNFVFNNNNLFLNGERVEGGNWFNTSAKVFENGKWATIIKQDKFAYLKEAHKNGAEIEIKWNDGTWRLVVDPSWDERNEYRVKPEEKPKVGDVVKAWCDNNERYVIGRIANISVGFEYRYGVNILGVVGVSNTVYYKNARTITKEEVVELLFKH